MGVVWIDTSNMYIIPHLIIFGKLIFIFTKFSCLFGKFTNSHYIRSMKTKSIIYKSFVPQVETAPVITQDEVPIFKYAGYKPRYK